MKGKVLIFSVHSGDFPEKRGQEGGEELQYSKLVGQKVLKYVLRFYRKDYFTIYIILSNSSHIIPML